MDTREERFLESRVSSEADAAMPMAIGFQMSSRIPHCTPEEGRHSGTHPQTQHQVPAGNRVDSVSLHISQFKFQSSRGGSQRVPGLWRTFELAEGPEDSPLL